MRTIKCVKLDFIKSMQMMRFLGLFLIIAVAMTFASGATPSFGALYMIFGALCVCSNNFFVTGGTEISTLVLPVTSGNRVFGRYLYGGISLTVCAAIGLFLSIGVMAFRKMPMDEQTAEIALTILYLGVGYAVLALQFLFLYVTRIKNAQILSLVRMVPAFVMFFSMHAIIEKIKEETASGGSLEMMQKAVIWCMTHRMQVAAAALAAGLVILLICSVLSWLRERKRY